MSKIDELKVYKASYDLHLQIYKSTKNICREYKYNLVQDIKKKSLKLLLNIYKATYNKEKRVKFIKKALEKCEFIRISFRVLKDLTVININKFVTINKMVEDVNRQLKSWLKFLNINNLNTLPIKENRWRYLPSIESSL